VARSPARQFRGQLVRSVSIITTIGLLVAGGLSMPVEAASTVVTGFTESTSSTNTTPSSVFTVEGTNLPIYSTAACTIGADGQGCVYGNFLLSNANPANPTGAYYWGNDSLYGNNAATWGIDITVSTSTELQFSVTMPSPASYDASQWYVWLYPLGTSVDTGDPANGTLEIASPPTLSAVSPGSGADGSAVTLTGSNFGTTPGAVEWTQNGTTVESVGSALSAWGDTAIQTTIPSTLSPGAVTAAVYNTTTGLLSGGVTVTVEAPFVPTTPTSVPPSSGTAPVARVQILSNGVAVPAGLTTIAAFDFANRNLATVHFPVAATQSLTITIRRWVGVPSGLPRPQDLFGIIGITVYVTQHPTTSVLPLPQADTILDVANHPLPLGTVVVEWNPTLRRWIQVATVTRQATTTFSLPIPTQSGVLYAFERPIG
jgi:hypothetical protein